MSSVTQSGLEFGKSLTSASIEAGLRELNVDINFDVALRKPGDFSYTLQTDPAKRKTMEKGRVPVCHGSRYVCAMDRGVVPEFKIWTVVEVPVEVDWRKADAESASVQYETIPFTEPDYPDLMSDAMHGQDDGLKIMPDGRLARMRCFAIEKRRGRIASVGWRHTFSNLINANIPGITAATLGEKFGVDMLKFPMGPPEEIHAAIVEE